MSEQVERRLAALLEHPRFDPYGNPIPGLAEIGEPANGVGFLDDVVPLAGEGVVTPTSQVTVARIAEPLQVDTELLARLADAGVTPGTRVDVERGDGLVTVGVPGSGVVLDLPDDVARHIFVTVG